jgi:hypothetical protein
MYDADPIATDRRKARWHKRLGENPRCILCGFTDPRALTKRRRPFEQHHVAGRENDPDLTVVVCFNCHAMQSDEQRQTGVPLDTPATLLHRIAAILMGVGQFLPHLGKHAFELGLQLQRFITLLDDRLPQWRDIKEDS